METRLQFAKGSSLFTIARNPFTNSNKIITKQISHACLSHPHMIPIDRHVRTRVHTEKHVYGERTSKDIIVLQCSCTNFSGDLQYFQEQQTRTYQSNTIYKQVSPDFKQSQILQLRVLKEKEITKKKNRKRSPIID